MITVVSARSPQSPSATTTSFLVSVATQNTVPTERSVTANSSEEKTPSVVIVTGSDDSNARVDAAHYGVLESIG